MTIAMKALALVVLSLAVGIVGCAGSLAPGENGSTPYRSIARDPVAAPSGGDPPLVYVSGNVHKGELMTYLQSGSRKPLHGFFGLDPNGLVVDSSGDLYVANTDGYNIPVYHHGETTPYRVLSTNHQGPAFLALDRTRDILYAAVEDTTIIVYARDSGQPTATLNTGFSSFITGLAVDSCGNLFATSDTSDFIEFPYGSTQPVSLVNQFGYNVYGLNFDARDNLIILASASPSYGTQVEVFAPPYSGAPVATAVLGYYSEADSFNADGSALWVLSGRPPFAQSLSYPGLKKGHKIVGERHDDGYGYFTNVATYPPPGDALVSPAETCPTVPGLPVRR